MAKLKFSEKNWAVFGARLFTALCGILPLRVNYFLGKIMGSIAYFLVARQSRIAVDNLTLAFPDKSLAEKKRIARDFYIFMAQGSFELLHIIKNPQELRNTRIEGGDYLQKALAGKKGVIIVTAHLGNFPLMSLRLARSGFPVNFVTRPMRNQALSDHLYRLRSDAGVKTIFSYPRRECVNNIVSALRNNEIVIMQMDQNFGTGGVWVKFFGELAATPVGPIVLGLRTDAAIIPAYIRREEPFKYCVRVFPQEELIRKPDKQESVLFNAVKFTRIIEGWVRKEGFQWGWIHRRWKSRPSDRVRAMRFKIESN